MSDIVREMTEITRCGIQFRSDALLPMGLKACHASYLTEICAHPGISQDKLARRICINKSNIARQAAALEEAGFITRAVDENDKRILRLYPTEKTVSLIPQINALLSQWESTLTTNLSPEEIAQLTAILDKMHRTATEWMEAQ